LETIEKQIDRIRAESGKLAPENLGRLDFDELRDLLDTQAETLGQVGRDREELAVLRRDLTARIAGMAKAIAAVSRQRERIRQAAEYVERLDEKSAADLIAEYRLVSVRFRDAFPTSFGRLFDIGRRQVRERMDRT